MAKKDMRVNLNFEELIADFSSIKNKASLEKPESPEMESDPSLAKNQSKTELDDKMKKIPVKDTGKSKRKVKSQKSSKKANKISPSISTKTIKSVATRSTPTKITIEIEFYDPRVSISGFSEHTEAINRTLLKSAKELLQNFE